MITVTNPFLFLFYSYKTHTFMLLNPPIQLCRNSGLHFKQNNLYNPRIFNEGYSNTLQEGTCDFEHIQVTSKYNLKHILIAFWLERVA